MSKELIEQLRDLANCRHDDLSIGYEAADRIEELEDEVERKMSAASFILKEHDALQAKIDELMLEYCPDEMTQDQINNWAKHQQAVPENELPEFLRKP